MTGVSQGYLRAPTGRMLVIAASLLAFGGCAATPPVTPRPTASPAAVPVPDGGVSLAQLGFKNPPATSISVPSSALVTSRVDQENVLTATFIQPSAADLAGWLRTHLPEAGFRITADRGDSLVFTGPGWNGAFTAQGGVSALTVRRD